MTIQSEFWDLDLSDNDPSMEDESDLKGVQTDAVVTATDWTVETILSQLNRGNIELNRDFQRREVWDDKKKSKFIESLFLGLPVPQIILAERQNERGKYIVLDGKQRLISLQRFGLDGPSEHMSPLTLIDLEIKSEFNNRSLVSLREDPSFEQDIRAYENQTIRTVVVRHWPDEKFLYLVFHRLNTNSVPLSPQELRHALHPGPFIDYAERYSSKSKFIQKALGLSGPDFRMRDVEILIRFLAFAVSIDRYRGNLKEFLDDLCERFNAEWDTQQSKIESLVTKCDEAIEATFAIFESDAFKRWRDSKRFENRFNRAVFDVMTYYFRDPHVAQLARDNRGAVIERFKALCSDDAEFNGTLQSTTKSVGATFYRLTKWGEALREILGSDIDIPQYPTGKSQ